MLERRKIYEKKHFKHYDCSYGLCWFYQSSCDDLGTMPIMTAAEYNNKVAEAALALVNHLITYDEWESYMKKLIKERENEIFKTK